MNPTRNQIAKFAAVALIGATGLTAYAVGQQHSIELPSCSGAANELAHALDITPEQIAAAANDTDSFGVFWKEVGGVGHVQHGHAMLDTGVALFAELKRDSFWGGPQGFDWQQCDLEVSDS